MFLINIRLKKYVIKLWMVEAVLKFVPGWFVTRKMIKIHFTDLFAHKYML